MRGFWNTIRKRDFDMNPVWSRWIHRLLGSAVAVVGVLMAIRSLWNGSSDVCRN